MIKTGTAEKQQLQYISIAKNLAVLLVVLGHAGCIYAGKWDILVVNNNSRSLKYITEYIYSFHMPFYVFISGYLYNYKERKNNSTPSLMNIISNKSKRLLLPYLLTGIFFMIPIQIIFNVYPDNQPFISRVIHEVLLAKRPTHLWYLLMLFSLFVLFRFMEKIINKNNPIINIILFSIVNFMSYSITKDYGAYYVSFSLKYLLYFYIGYIFNRYIKIMITPFKIVSYFTIHGLLFCFKDLILKTLKLTNTNFNILNIIIIQLISIMGILWLFSLIYFLCNTSSRFINIVNNRFYKIIDKCNFHIYLFHHPIMVALIVSMSKINISAKLLYIIISIATLFLSVISSKLVGLIVIFTNKILKREYS